MELVALLQRLQFQAPDAEQKQVRQQVEDCIRYLIQNDFSRLVQILYTVDVKEQTLKQSLLQQPQGDAAQIITDLLISRQEEKARSRRQFSTENIIDEEERW